LQSLQEGQTVRNQLGSHDLDHMFYLHTKFGNSSFSCSGDKIVCIEIENGSCDPDHTLCRGDLSSES